MKMKSKFFGFNVKLALMLVAICGAFASCYEKEEIDVPAPSTQDPIYLIKGIVTDESTGDILPSAKVNGVTVGTDGSYTVTATEGTNIIKFEAADHVSATTSVYVDKKDKGTTTVYTVNAALRLGEGEEEPVTYKKVEYLIKGSVTDVAGNAVNIKTIYVSGAPTQPAGAVGTSKFEFTTTTIGTYEAYITADGYMPALATIYVSAVAPEEGPSTEIQTVEVKVGVIMEKEADKPTIIDPVYYVQGNLYNDNGTGANDVNVKMTTKTGYSNSTKTTKGLFYFELTSNYVPAATIGTINCTQANYKPFATSFLILPVVGSSTTPVTSTITIMGNLKPVNGGDVPDEDVSTGGSETIEVPVEDADIKEVEKAGDEATVEEIKDAVTNIMKPEDVAAAEVKPEEVADIIQNMKDEGKIESIENVASVKVETPKVVEVASTIATGEGSSSSTKEEIDQITIPAGVIVYATGEAKNVVITRDPAAEKATAATRVYTGEPTGTIFTTPLEVKFESPIAITETPDFDLNILYEQADGTWKKGDTKATFKNGKFEGAVKHFSKFKFGFDSKYGVEKMSVDSVTLAPIIINKPCFTGAAAQPVIVNITYDGGMKYAPYDESKPTITTPSLAVANQLAGSNQSTTAFVTDMMTKMIKSNNLNILPTPNYTKQKTSAEMVIPAYAQVTGFEVYRTQITYTSTIYVTKTGASEAIPVKVKISKIISATVKPIYTTGHGHGHGEDLNAGGGIINAE